MKRSCEEPFHLILSFVSVDCRYLAQKIIFAVANA